MPTAAFREVLNNARLCVAPADDETFEPSVVPGFCDGDYPQWLQREMDDLLPREFLEEFGERQNTMLNGSYWHLDLERLAEILRALKHVGFEIEQREDLMFW